MDRSVFTYATYIRTSPEDLWAALTDPEIVARYWFGSYCVSDWQPGSSWQLLSSSGKLLDAGEIVSAAPLRKLVIRWTNQHLPEAKAEGPSLCTIELEPVGQAVKLTIIHEIERSPSLFINAVSGGWPKIISNLKSILETGSSALADAYPELAGA